MKVLKGYVFRLYPNGEQKTLINKTIGFVRLIYNIFLSDRIDTYNNTKKGKFAYDHFCKQGGFPKFKAKGVKDSYKTNNVVSTYKEKVYNSIELDLEKRLIKLPKLKWVKIKGYRNKESINGRIRSAVIRKTPQDITLVF